MMNFTEINDTIINCNTITFVSPVRIYISYSTEYDTDTFMPRAVRFSFDVDSTDGKNRRVSKQIKYDNLTKLEWEWVKENENNTNIPPVENTPAIYTEVFTAFEKLKMKLLYNVTQDNL